MARTEWVKLRLDNWALWKAREAGDGRGWATQSAFLGTFDSDAQSSGYNQDFIGEASAQPQEGQPGGEVARQAGAGDPQQGEQAEAGERAAQPDQSERREAVQRQRDKQEGSAPDAGKQQQGRPFQCGHAAVDRGGHALSLRIIVEPSVCGPS